MGCVRLIEDMWGDLSRSGHRRHKKPFLCFPTGGQTGSWSTHWSVKKTQRGLGTVQSLCSLSPARCFNDGERKGPRNSFYQSHRASLIQTNSSKHPFFSPQPRLPFSFSDSSDLNLPSVICSRLFPLPAHFVLTFPV